MTPDPRFLYLSATHKEALAQLLYGVKERKGFVVLSGEVGTGKTTVVRAMLERLDENCQFAYIFNTKLSVLDFLRLVCHDFGLHVRGEAKTDYLISLHDFLIESDNDGKTTTLIVDEAQNLDASVFEEIRMLTNLEAPSHKLLQIFLIGQPELNVLLDQADLQQLKQRVSTRYHLIPLDQRETREYIHLRMRIAGARFMNCFTEGAIQKIYHYSHGIPRLINNICDNALLLGYANDTPIISEKTVRECVVDLDLQKGSKNHGRPCRGEPGKGRQRRSIVYFSLLVLLLALLASGVFLFLTGRIGNPYGLSKPAETVKPLQDESRAGDVRDPGAEETAVPGLSEGARPVASGLAGAVPPARSRKNDGEELEEPRVPEAPAVSQSPEARTVTVGKGDTLGRIIFREYGRVDTHLLRAVQELNPDITDIDTIFVGQQVGLPADLEQAYNKPGRPSYFSVHVASFKAFDHASKFFKELMERGEKPAIVPATINGKTWYRVAVGEYGGLREALTSAKRLVRTGRTNYAKPIKLPDLPKQS